MKTTRNGWGIGRRGMGIALLTLLLGGFAPQAVAANVTWTGPADNQWNKSTQNWTNDATGALAAFADGDGVTFSGGANTDPIAISGTNRPASINITTTGGPFRFTGGTIRFDTSGNNSYSFGSAALHLDGGSLWFNFTGGARPGTVTLSSPVVIGPGGAMLDLRQTGSSANVNLSNTLTLNGGTLTVKGQSVTDRSYLQFALQNTVTLAASTAIEYDSQYYNPGTGLIHNQNVISGAISGPTRILTLSGAGYVILNNGGANFDVAGLAIAGAGKVLQSAGESADFLSTLRGHTPTGGVVINAGTALSLANGGHWRWSDFSLGSGATVAMGAYDVLWTWDVSFAVGAGQNLTWSQNRAGQFYVGDAGNALTVNSGGLFRVNSVKPNNDCNVDFRAKLTLLGGSTFEGLVNSGLSDTPTKPCGIIQQYTAGTRLNLGDGSAATPETITIQGINNYATDRNRNFVIGVDSGNITDDGNVVLKYGSQGADPNTYFNIQWENSYANKNVQPFRGGSAGTEFAPGTGNAGIAVVGPVSGDVMTIVKPTTLTTAGTVGFYRTGSASGTGFYVSRATTPGAVGINAGGSLLVTNAAGRVLAGDLTASGGTVGGAGRFEVTGALFTNGATYQVWLYGAATNQCGRLEVSNALAFASGCVLAVAPTNGFTPSANQSWNVARASSIGTPLPSAPSGYTLEVQGEYLKLIKLDTSGYGPQILNRPATNVQHTSAFLNGYVQSTGMAPVTVSVFWGPADGGSNVVESTWSRTNTFAGNPGANLGLSTNVALAQDTYYYYRYYATNEYGDYMARPVESFITGDIDVFAVDAAAETGPLTGRFSIVRAAALTNEDLTVSYAISGTAGNGADYASPAGTVMIARGATNAIVEVAPIGDALVEGSESVILTVLPGAYVVGPAPTATVWIADYVAKNLTWTGGADSNWNTGTVNWTGDATTYREGDHVVFDDTSTRNSVATPAGGVTPASVLITNAVRSYTFTGGGIRGPARLIKRGSGTLRFLAADMTNCLFSGGLAVEQGVLKLDTQGSAAPYRVGTGDISLEGVTLHMNYTGGGRPGTVDLANRVVVGSAGATFNMREDVGAGNINFVGGIELGGNLRVEGQAVGDQTVLTTGFTGPIALTTNATITFVEPSFGYGGLNWNYNTISGGVVGNQNLTLSGLGQVTISNGGTNFAPHDFTADVPAVVLWANGAADDFFAGVRSNGGKVILGAGRTLTGIRGGTWYSADLTWGAGSTFSLDQQNNHAGSDQTLQGSFTLGSGAALRWVQHRGGVFYIKDGAARGMLTVANGGTFQAWVTENRWDTFPRIDADLRLTGGATLDGRHTTGTSGERPGGIRRNAGTLYLGDGDAGTAETVTIQGVTTWASNLKRPWFLDFANSTTDDGNVVIRYASVGSDTNQAFNVGWLSGDSTVYPFREGSAGTEFAPGTNNGGVAVVGPAAGTLFTVTKAATITTAGTVGFYEVTNLGGNYGGERGALGAVVVVNGGTLAFTTNGVVAAGSLDFAAGSTLAVTAVGTATNAISYLRVSGALNFASGTLLNVSNPLRAAPPRGGWYVAEAATITGQPTVSGYGVVIEPGSPARLKITPPPGSMFTFR